MNVSVPAAVLGARLQTARKASGLTQQAVAERLGMARTTVVAIEKGERAVRPDELVAMAALYQRPLSELVRHQQPLGTIALQFRAGAPVQNQAALEQECRQLAEDYLYVEALRHAPMPRALPAEAVLGDDPRRAARLAAEDERRRLGLGTGPVTGVRLLLEERVGARVFLLPAQHEPSLSGVYFYDELAGPVICVSRAHHWHRRRWSFAHEYGHLVASRHEAEVTYDDGVGADRRRSPAEIFADAFARHLLIPTSAIERLVAARKHERGGRFLVEDIGEFAAQFGVSLEAMARALDDEGLVKPGTAALVKRLGYAYPLADQLEAVFATDRADTVVPPRFERLAVTAFRSAEITEGTLARVLRLDRLDARDVARRALPPADLDQDVAPGVPDGRTRS